MEMIEVLGNRLSYCPKTSCEDAIGWNGHNEAIGGVWVRLYRRDGGRLPCWQISISPLGGNTLYGHGSTLEDAIGDLRRGAAKTAASCALVIGISASIAAGGQA